MVGRLHARQVVSTHGSTCTPNAKRYRLAHWLGRPSHINDRQFSVAPLEVADFAVDTTAPASSYLSRSIEAFVMLTKLTRVLSSVLDNFYTIARTSCMMPAEEALSRASNCQAQLGECLSEQGSVLLRPSRVINGELRDYLYRVPALGQDDNSCFCQIMRLCSRTTASQFPSSGRCSHA